MKTSSTITTTCKRYADKLKFRASTQIIDNFLRCCTIIYSKCKLILIPFACSCNSAGRLHLLYPLLDILDSFQWMPGQSRLFAKLNFEYRLQLRSQTSNPCYNLAKDNKSIFSRFIWLSFELCVFASIKYLNLPLRRNLYTISSLKFEWVIS